MTKLLSNGSAKGTIRAVFEKLSLNSKKLWLAAPYFSYEEPIIQAAKRGCSIQLLVGLNSATHPDALKSAFANRNITIRFYTDRFHAKLYVFDSAALIGSANLTNAGFQGNREVMAWVTEADDPEALDESRIIFHELWDGARALSQGTIVEFEAAWTVYRRIGPDPDAAITTAVGGKIEPPSLSVDKRAAFAAQLALERLRRQVQEEYTPAFAQVSEILSGYHLNRQDVLSIDQPFRTNRFLNWLRLTYAPGDSWEEVPERSNLERQEEIIRLAREWRDAPNGRVYEGYAEGIQGVLSSFADPIALAGASKEALTAGLLGIHAFDDQKRFTKDGALSDRFWEENDDDVARVRETLLRLLHGRGDVVDRLHEVTSDPRYRLRLFGKFCGLELLGTVKPVECPPVNGRSAKALRFLGYKISAV